MLFDVVEQFGPESGKPWAKYLAWRGLKLTRFDSLDGMLRSSVVELESAEDWSNCQAEKFKSPLITNKEFAMEIQSQHQHVDVVGIEIVENNSYSTKTGFLGYEIIDSHGDISMLTNWGKDEENLFSMYISENGLILGLAKALEVREVLRRQFSECHHAMACEVWALYRIEQ